MKSSNAYRSIPSSLELESNSEGAVKTNSKSKSPSVAVVVLATVIVVIVLSLVFSFSGKTTDSFAASNDTVFDSQDRYILRDFSTAKPMSNFLAGLGGFWGIPMWVFYVNRGQGVTSFGIQNKDGAISMFKTAEKAYQQTPFTGFRTFIRGVRSGVKWEHMPFFPTTPSTSRNMMIGMNEMEIEEVADEIGLQTNVLYYTITDEDFPGLIRKTTFTNIGEGAIDIDVLDGLGQLVPSGLSNWAEYAMGRTMEAWMHVYNVDDGDFSLPFFHITQGTADVTTVQPIYDGHFSVAFVEKEGKIDPLQFIVDPSLVFQTDTTLVNPAGFFGSNSLHMDSFMKQPQGITSRTPCAFAGSSFTVQAGASVSIISVYGHAPNLQKFKKISKVLLSDNFAAGKYDSARNLVDELTKTVATSTSSPLFDAYVKQDYLDNLLRGGLPVLLGSDSKKVFHTFSRIHGDIERDYNNFQIDTTFYSQGPGNFRDVCQNRRLDVLLSPMVEDFDIRMFLSFVQADGYNPLTVASTNFKVRPDKVASVIAALGVTDSQISSVLTDIFASPFRIGQLFTTFTSRNVKLTGHKEDIVRTVLDSSDQVYAAQFAQNGFWSDHWTYILDLIDSFKSVYPDKEVDMLWNSEGVPFFMSPAIVKPRLQRYVLHPNLQGNISIHVDSAIAIETDPGYPAARISEVREITQQASYVGDSFGAGGVWQRDLNKNTVLVSPIAKLAMLGIIKFSTLDPSGMGVEMEGGKPGWNDAMNGLPGLLGSGMPETFEMLRILRYVKSVVLQNNKTVVVPIEFSNFVADLMDALGLYNVESMVLTNEADFKYWDRTNTARELYRSSVSIQFSGVTTELGVSFLVSAISLMESKVLTGIEKAKSTNFNGVMPTYFFHQCTDFDQVAGDAGIVNAIPKSFVLKSVPLFLEGPTRFLKVIEDDVERSLVYSSTKSSSLYDGELNMFMISESLSNMGADMGRMKAFAAGWLENQSVWLHMSYKFYLELLRGGLYEEFFTELLSGLVPFMDNSKYGRSPLEAASFIVSSAFPDPKLHGAGFLARLSGSTAEFLSMWSIMMSGHSPFLLEEDGSLNFSLRPVLPGWLFPENGVISYTFLGGINVSYFNPHRLNTWQLHPVQVTLMFHSGEKHLISSGVVESEYAERIRNLEVRSMEVVLSNE